MHTVDKYNMLHSAPRQLLVGFFRVLDFGSFACADWRLPCHCAADTGLRPHAAVFLRFYCDCSASPSHLAFAHREPRWLPR